MAIDEIIVSAARDVASHNPVLTLPSVRAGVLGVVRFEQQAEAGQKRSALRLHCLRAAVDSLRLVWPGLNLWLFASTSAWQPKTRVVMWRGLFRSLSASNVDVPTGARSEEASVENGDRIRYFGLVGVPLAEIGLANAVLDYEPHSFLVVSLTGEPLELSGDLVAAWRAGDWHGLGVWSGLAEYFRERDGVVFRPFGFFDDVSVGVDLLLGSDRLQEYLFAVGTASG